MATGKAYNFRITSEGLEEFKRNLEALGTEGQKAFQKLADSSPQLVNALNKAQEAAERARVKLQDTEKDGVRAGRGIESMGQGALAAVRRIDDLGRSLLGGGNAMEIALRQGSLFLGMMGPWGAVIGGAVAAIGGLALGMGVLGGDTKTAKEAIEEFNKAVGEADALLLTSQELSAKMAATKRAEAVAHLEAAAATKRATLAKFEELAVLQRAVGNRGGPELTAGVEKNTARMQQLAEELLHLEQQILRLKDDTQLGTNREADAKRQTSLETYIAGLEQAARLSALDTEQKKLQQALLEAESKLLDEKGKKSRDLTEAERARIATAVELQSFNEREAKLRETIDKQIEKNRQDEERRNLAVDKYIGGLEAIAKAEGLSTVEKKVQLALVEAQNQLLDEQGNKLRELTDVEKQRIRNAVETKSRYEEQAKAAEAAQRRIEQTIQHSTDRVVDFTADAFDKIFEKGKGSWEEIGAAAISIMRRALAQIAAEAIIRPIIQPVVTSAVGSAMGGGSGTGSIGGIGGGGSGGGFDLFGSGQDILSIGNSIFGDSTGTSSMFGMSGAIDAFGASAFGMSEGVTMASLGAETGAFSSALPNAVGSGAMGSTTLSGLLGGVGAGFAAGMLIGNLTGGNPTGVMVGSATGAIAGAIIGSIIPGIGTLIGGLIGGAAGGGLGGLFGNNNPSVGPNGGLTLNIDPSNGVGLEVVGGGGDNGFDPGVFSPLAAAATKGYADAIKRMGGTVTGFDHTTGIDMFTFNAFKGQLTAGQGIGGAGKPVSTADEAVQQVVMDAMRASIVSGIDPDVQKVMRNSKATNIKDYFSDIDFAMAITGGMVEIGPPEELSKSEQIIAEINKQFEALTMRATDLGLAIDGLNSKRDEALAKLKEGFNDALQAGIDGFVAPMKGMMEALGKAQENRLKEAKALGADLVQLERLNALERAAVLDQALGGIKALRADLESGSFSGLAPMGRYDATRAAYEAEAAAALRGEGSPAFGAAARAFIEASRTSFASGAQYQTDRLNVLATLSAISPPPGFADEGSFRVPSGGGRDGMVPFFRTDGGEVVTVQRERTVRDGDAAAERRHKQTLNGLGAIYGELARERKDNAALRQEIARLVATLHRSVGAA